MMWANDFKPHFFPQESAGSEGPQWSLKKKNWKHVKNRIEHLEELHFKPQSFVLLWF